MLTLDILTPDNVLLPQQAQRNDWFDSRVGFQHHADTDMSRFVMRPEWLADLISKFMQNRKICCFEISEVNPTLDKENLMAEIAFNILQRSVNILMMY